MIENFNLFFKKGNPLNVSGSRENMGFLNLDTSSVQTLYPLLKRRVKSSGIENLISSSFNFTNGSKTESTNIIYVNILNKSLDFL